MNLFKNEKEKKLNIVYGRSNSGMELGRSPSTSKKIMPLPEENLSPDEEIAERIYALKKENNQLGNDAIFLAELLLKKINEQSTLMDSLKTYILQSDERNKMQIKPVIDALTTLENRISKSAAAADSSTAKELKRFFTHLENAGKAYSKGQCERLDKTVKSYEMLLAQGREDLDFWSFGKKLIIAIITFILLFQFYINHQINQQLEGLHTQVRMIHTLYKGDTKYWFDPNNQKTYVETQKQHEQRE